MSCARAVDRRRDGGAMGAERQGALPQTISGISIDSRSIVPGDAFFAIAGDNRDGHDFVATALAAKAGARRGRRRPADAIPRRRTAARRARCACRDCAISRPRRAREPHAKVIGVTGSVGKTSTKEALRLALSKDGETHASVASYNNHWGVPLSLARCPATARYAVLEMGMNHQARSNRCRAWSVRISPSSPRSRRCIWNSRLAGQDRRCQGRDLLGVVPGGAALLNRDIAQFAHLKRRAKEAGVARVLSFGEHAAADAHLVKCALHPRCSTVEARHPWHRTHL